MKFQLARSGSDIQQSHPKQPLATDKWGNDTNKTRHNVVLTEGKTSSAAREQEKGSWCRAAGSCVGQMIQDLSTGRDVILEHFFLVHLNLRMCVTHSIETPGTTHTSQQHTPEYRHIHLHWNYSSFCKLLSVFY